MSNQGWEPTLSSRPQVERSGSMNDVPPPPAYEIAVTQPTPVAEEGHSICTGIERERTPPIVQSNAPIKTQPSRLEFQHPLDPTQNDPSRNPSNETLLSSNAAHARAAQSASALQEREEESGQSATVERTGTAPFEQPLQPKQNGNVINIFCCCSSRGASPGQYKRFSILWLPTHFPKGQ